MPIGAVCAPPAASVLPAISAAASIATTRDFRIIFSR
jgi:hypothetical protein